MTTEVTMSTEDAQKQYRKNYYERNKDAVLEANKAWREANPEKVREIHRAWREANEGFTYETTDGYVKYIGYAHPATNTCGVTPYHRVVLWDKLDGKNAACNWCGKDVFWDADDYDNLLVVDHVNTVKNDNRPENLVPACHRCNVSRPGGQNRKARLIDGPCDFEGCDSDAKSRSKDSRMVLCSGHWQQDNKGQELRPLRAKKILRKDDNGRVCTECETYKTWDNFGLTSNRKHHRAKCNPCMTAISQAARARRLAAGMPCSEAGCTNPADVKGLCSVCYHREWTKAGGN